MLKNLSRLIGLALIALFAIAIAGCSAVPAPLQQALATATTAPTQTATAAPTTAPAAKAPTQPKATPPAAANNPLAQLRRLGLTGGTVATNDGTTLSLKQGKMSEQLQIAPTTLVVVPGLKSAQPSDVKVGDRVIADLKNGDSTSTPSLVLDFPKGYTTDNVMTGLIMVNAKGTATLRTRNGSQDVTPAASTVVVNMLGDQPTLGSVTDATRGDAAVVIGQKNGDQYSPQVIVLINRAAIQGNRKQAQPTGTPTP